MGDVKKACMRKEEEIKEKLNVIMLRIFFFPSIDVTRIRTQSFGVKFNECKKNEEGMAHNRREKG